MNEIESVKFWNDKTKQYDDYTHKVVYPIKIADLLDEQLDEMELTLKHVAVEYFQPLTIVMVSINCKNNSPVSEDFVEKVQERMQTDVFQTYPEIQNGVYYQRLLKYFIVANDTSNEVMGLKVQRGENIGKSVYNHQIYLIEITKIAEGFIGDALTFTNTLGNDFTGENNNPPPVDPPVDPPINPPVNPSTANIHWRGTGINNNGIIQAEWNSDTAIPTGSTVYYEGDTAIALSWDNSTNAVRLQYAANSSFTTAAGNHETITVEFTTGE